MIKILATAARTVAAKVAGYLGREQSVVLRHCTAEGKRVETPVDALRAGSAAMHEIVRHYVPVRGAVVARTWLGADFVEVTVLRKGRKHATYQGHVEAVPGGWRAVDPDGRQVYLATGSAVSYLDVEARLVAVRTGHRAAGDYEWPHEMRIMLAPRPKPSCRTCGTELYGEQCPRTDLHWTAESLAQRTRERAERRAAALLVGSA